MAYYGHGTGNYLTNFEDYYKSSEESEEEGEGSGARDTKVPVDSDSTYYTESEEEDRPSYQGKTKEEHQRKEDKKKSLSDFKIRGESLQSLRDYAVEESEDIFNDDDKEKVFSTEAISIQGSNQPGTKTVTEKQLSDNYADLLKTVCKERFPLSAKQKSGLVLFLNSMFMDLKLFFFLTQLILSQTMGNYSPRLLRKSPDFCRADLMKLSVRSAVKP